MALYFLYFVEAIGVLGLLSLMVGGLWKAATYPTKEVHYINEYGNARVKLVDDPTYYYKKEELWEPPPQWQFEKTAKEEAKLPVQEINHFGDDDWTSNG